MLQLPHLQVSLMAKPFFSHFRAKRQSMFHETVQVLLVSYHFGK